jgi:hypothetical protein
METEGVEMEKCCHKKHFCSMADGDKKSVKDTNLITAFYMISMVLMINSH